MIASASLLPVIEEAVGRDAATRAATLERVTTLFLTDAERLSDEQVGLFDEVIGRLIAELEGMALAELSQRLAPIGNAPVGVIRRLANDGDIAVAGPVLRQSARLSEDDLIAIAQSSGQVHLLALSSRDVIGRGLGDVLIRRGDREVARSVAANSGAALSEAAITALVHRARQDGILAERIGGRGDLPPYLFRRLVVQAAAVVQVRLLATATPQMRAEIRRVMAKVADEVDSVRPRDYADALALVDTLARIGSLDETSLAAFAKTGDFEATVATFAALSKIPLHVIDRLIDGNKPDPVLVLCKALQFQWSTVAAVLSLRLRPGTSSLDNAFDQFGRMSVATAQRILHFWRARPNGINVSVAAVPV